MSILNALVLATSVLSAAAPKYCKVFTDDFNGPLDTSVWTHDVTLGGGGNWEFQYYTNNRTNSYTEDGKLYLMPTLTSDKIGEDAVRNGGTMDLWQEGCTSNGFFGCSRSSNGQNIINPIQSALIRSKNSVSIKYGKVEVRARLPKGDWIWPAIWMLPKDDKYGTWPASGEIDIMESRGNAPGTSMKGVNSFGSTLHWGPDFAGNQWPKTHKTFDLPQGTLNDDFHTYGLMWDENSIITYIDSPENKVLEVPLDDFFKKGEYPADRYNPWKSGSKSAPFDQEFYLIMNVAVGGTASYFPDDAPGKPWANNSPISAKQFYDAKDQWYKTWPADNKRALAIDSVNIWNTC